MKTLIVTGGSRGIGAATARLAANRGYAVCVNYRRQLAEAQSIVDEIVAAGGTAVAIKADVTSEDAVIDLFRQTHERLGEVSALVNNAGILETQSRLENMTVERIRRVFDTNVLGTFLCSREAIKRMSEQHGGSGGAIVNVSSMAAKLGAGGEYIDYAASKGAIDSMTRGMATELATQGIRVNGVRPGIIYTDIHASGGEPGRVDRVKGAVPMQRGGDASEVAEAILWLLSDQASYCTGTFIDVSGGR